MNDKLRLGWIGTGVMGHAMAGHLLASGYPLTVYNRTKARAEGLLACGARWADTPQEVARNSDVVFSIVGYPRDVEEVMLGEQGALSGLAEGGILCDMTTSSPELARRIAEAAAAKGCISLDAPVTGVKHACPSLWAATRKPSSACVPASKSWARPSCTAVIPAAVKRPSWPIR